MPSLEIRDLPGSTYSSLRARAALHQRSIEAEAQAILTEACRTALPPSREASLQEWVTGLYGGNKPGRLLTT